MIKGILLSVAIGLLSVIMGGYTPSVLNGILIALILGMIIGNIVKIPATYDPGISVTSNRMLEFSILFLAFNIDYKNIAAIGVGSFSLVVLVVFAVLILTILVSKWMKCPGSIGWLVGFGTTICGSSAIAALAPSIAAKKEDVAVSMATVNLYGSIGMVVLPFILMYLNFSVSDIGLILGGSLHSVGNVAGAGYAISQEVGEAALTIKLARVALLSPGLIFFNFIVNRKQGGSWYHYFRLPWYLIGFLLITFITSFVSLPQELPDFMEEAGKVVLTIAMAAIGLKVNFANLLNSGKKGLVFGLVIFTIQLVIISFFIFLR